MARGSGDSLPVDANPVDLSTVTFRDILEFINPLQHLPIVGSIYRAATGETISSFGRIVGGLLLGGPIGFVAAAVNAAIDNETGNDIGGHIIATVMGDDKSTDPAPATAPSVATDASPTTNPAPAVDGSQGNGPATSNAAALAVAVPAQKPAQPRSAPGGIPIRLPTAAAAEPADTPANAVIAAAARGLPLQPGGGRQPIPLRSNPVNAGTSAPVPLQLSPIAIGKPPLVPTNLSLPQNPPVDLSQKMMDALDKYAKLNQERGRSAGTAVDIAQ
jgi:hypothetical protein